MGGWKMVAARRAAARIVDTLTEADRFAVLTFDDRIDRPAGLAEGLAPGTDRNRYRAVEHLARVDARGGTELLPPLQQAAGMLSDPERDRVLVLVTDGQVGNEDQLLARLTPALREVRVHAVGIDRAVNAGFLGRLSALGGGRCELVESEDRLDEATDRIHQRIGAPLVTGLKLAGEGLDVVAGTVAPDRLPAIFPGVPLVVRGRWRGAPGGALVLTGTTAAGEPWRQRVAATPVAEGALTPVWARAHLRDLEDEYAAWAGDPGALERRIVATSLRYGVLCRFTAFVAVDARVVNEGGVQHRVVQPVELPEGWELPAAPVGLVPMAMHMPMPRLTDMDAVVAQEAAVTEAAETATPVSPPPSGSPTAQARVNPFAAGARPPRAAAGRRRTGAGTDALATARLQAADEARRLRSTGSGGSLPQRWAALADLGSRLEALLRDLTGLADEAELVPLRSLVAGLATCDGPNPPRGADLDALWQRALLVLDAFAGSQSVPATGVRPDLPSGGSAATTGRGATLTGRPDLSPGGRARGAFWKRSDRG
jgi:Ca-activated chloride channel family protein